MRILIISPSRTGGNVFSKWLSCELSYKWAHEPFNINNNLTTFRAIQNAMLSGGLEAGFKKEFLERVSSKSDLIS